MQSFKYCFPFSAVVGQAAARQALLCCAVNPAIGGVLLSGEKGTAKSTLVRGLAALLGGTPFVELPLNATEDRLIGTLDLEEAIRTGRARLQGGLLHAADGGFLYIDEVNLLPERLTNTVLEVAASGVNRVEREGLSAVQDAEFVLVGSMNPEEGPLRSQFLDRFGLYISVTGEHSVPLRKEILRRRLAYEASPSAFCDTWHRQQEKLAERILLARRQLPKVQIREGELAFAAELAAEGCCAGHRAELTLCETARALAALEGSGAVTEAHLRTAAAWALPHRLRKPVELEQQERFQAGETQPAENTPAQAEAADAVAPPSTAQPDEPESWQDAAKPTAEVRLDIPARKVRTPAGTGKRLKTSSDSDSGHAVRDKLPHGTVRDPAIAASLRAAALHSCDDPALRISVRPDDLRETVRERRTGATILFLVDASGSMGAQRRMGAVKGAVISILNDAYQKRDTVGIAAFRRTGAEVLLPFTRSVDLAQKRLRTLKTGGTTPLAAGLDCALRMFCTDRLKHTDSLQYLILVSDGRANYAAAGDAMEAALAAAKQLAAFKIRAMVLDTESGFVRFGGAKKIADVLGAEAVPLNLVSGGEIETLVRNNIPQ